MFSDMQQCFALHLHHFKGIFCSCPLQEYNPVLFDFGMMVGGLFGKVRDIPKKELNFLVGAPSYVDPRLALTGKLILYMCIAGKMLRFCVVYVLVLSTLHLGLTFEYPSIKGQGSFSLSRSGSAFHSWLLPYQLKGKDKKEEMHLVQFRRLLEFIWVARIRTDMICINVERESYSHTF